MTRRPVVAWALYDFGNSAFTTLVVTFVYATWFTTSFAGSEVEGTALWSRAVTITALVVALLSPILGALADRGGYRKRTLFLCTVVAILGTAALYPIRPPNAILALVVFTIANIAFEMANVFYNAFLPDITTSKNIGRVSGFGWGLGYVGGILALVLALVFLIQSDPPLFGLDAATQEPLRATNLLVAAWYAVFALPIFLFVKEDRSRVSPPGTPIVRAAFGQLRISLKEIGKYRQVVRFLVARVVFNDGLVTVFAFGGIYAAGTFGFDTAKLIKFGILLNVTAALGAWFFGFVDDRVGGKRTIVITLVCLIMTTLAVLLTSSESVFWVCGALLGIFVGPNQAASRSLMGRFVPPDKENEFFGFFAFSGKATAFMGPLLLGLIATAFDSQRAGFAVVLVFFAVGLLLLSRVDEAEGRDAAGRT
jgi:UMF1 family MFS transporter